MRHRRAVARRHRLTAALFETLEGRRLLTTATLVQDLSPGDTSTSVQQPYIVSDNLGFFVVYNGNSGSLYRTDGTESGTSALQSFTPSPQHLTAAGPLVYFEALGTSNLRQVWRSDGTPTGTFQVTNFTDSNPTTSDYTSVGDTLFFQVISSQGTSLWKSQGTAQTTVPVCDPGQFQLFSGLINFGGTLYFSALQTGSQFGEELWKSDGTRDGTVQVKDINPGIASSTPGALLSANGKLYFEANDGVNGSGLWVTDGTDAGTMLIKTESALGITISGPQSIVAAGNVVYFTAWTNGLLRLYKTDGTPDGTSVLLDLISTNSAALADLTAFNGELYFTAVTPTRGRELWKSDGTPQGTVMAADIAPGQASSNPTWLTVFKDKLYFAATDPVNSQKLRAIDGISSDVQIIDVSQPGNASGNAFNLAVYSGAPAGPRLLLENTDVLHGIEPWISDGTPQGTTILKNISTGTIGSSLSNFVTVGNRTFFNGPFGLAVTDGVAAHTFFLAAPGIDGAAAQNSAVLNGVLIYAGNGQLWRSDGSRDGTYMISSAFTSAASLARVANLVYFSAADAVHGNELWRTDGTAEGTALAVDVTAGKTGSSPVKLSASNNTLFFAHGNGTLSKSDGTPAGTKDLLAVPSGDSMGQFQSFNDLLYFTITNAVWRSDGTTTGTVNLTTGKSLTVAKTSPLCQLGSLIYFLAGSPAGGTGVPGLYKIDPNNIAAGATLVKAVGTAVDSTTQAGYNLTVMGGRLYFVGPKNTTLWVSDGTAAGTQIVSSIAAASLTPVGNLLYFTSAAKLWVTDGSVAGTVPVANTPSPDVTAVANLTAVDGALLFSAFHPLYNTELWTVTADAPIPAAPTDLMAIPVSGGQIHLTWSDNSSVESGFQIDRAIDPLFANITSTVILQPNRTSYDDHPLASGTPYYYRLSAVSRSGNSPSIEASATTSKAAPPAPTNLAAIVPSDQLIQLSWTDNASDETGYILERATNPAFSKIDAAFTLAPNTTAYDDISASPLFPYYYRVYATGAAGNSDYASLRVVTPDHAPTQLQAAGVSANQINLLWNDLSTTTTQFEVDRASSDSGPFTALAQFNSSQTSYSDTTVSPLSTWFYRVIAMGTLGNSVSKIVSATSLSNAPLTTSFTPASAPANSKPDSMVNFKGAIYFTFSPLSRADGSLYRTDGTAAGTTLILSGRITHLLAGGDHLYFTVYAPETGLVLWISDGTPQGTHALCDPSTADVDVVPLGWLGDKLLFGVAQASSIYDLWSSDGTVAGTIRLFTNLVNLGTQVVNTQPIVFNGVLYFNGIQNGQANDLWRSDGTIAGTYRIKAVSPQTGCFTVLGNNVYFIAYDQAHQWALWKTDGTADGTVVVADPVDDSNSPSLTKLTAGNGMLYFQGPGGTWRSDGTAQGTFLLNSQATAPTLFTAAGNWVYFFAKGYLWKTDGSPEGTMRASLVSLTNNDQFMIAVGSDLFFCDGQTLWRTDGTFTGTIKVATIASNDSPQSNISYSGALAAVLGDMLVFGAMTADQQARELRIAYATAPAAPDSLAVIPSGGQATGVRLTWADHASTESAYIVERSTTADFASVSAAFTLPANTRAYIDTTANIGDPFYYRVRAVNAGGQSAASNIVTSGAPKVLSAEFRYDVPAPQLILHFNADVSASLLSGAIHLQNQSSLSDIPSAQIVVAYDHSEDTASVTLIGGKFPDGRYRLTLKGSEISANTGLSLDGDGDGTAGGDFVFDFFQLAGDANRDASVGFSDLVAVAQHYGASGQKWAQGDVTGDGKVDFADLVTIAQHYGQRLAAPAPSPAAVLLTFAPPPLPHVSPGPASKPAPVRKPTDQPPPTRVFSQKRIDATIRKSLRR